MASDVSIDLNGFRILGHIPFALASGTIGINATFSGVNNVSVRNGTVALFGVTNVALGDDGVVENVRTYGATGDGIDCGKGCLIKGNVIYGNGSLGLSLGGPTAGYLQNVLSDNDGITAPGAGGQISGGTSLGQNLCNGAVC